MQVFVPLNLFSSTAEVLDNRRLNKQAVEGLQILDILYDRPTKTGKPRTGWLNHPAVVMWKNNKEDLASYVSAVVEELRARGYKTETYVEYLSELPLSSYAYTGFRLLPTTVKQSHRFRLLQKGWEELLKAETVKQYERSCETILNYYTHFCAECFVDDLFNEDYWWLDGDRMYQAVSKERELTKIQLRKAFGANPHQVHDIMALVVNKDALELEKLINRNLRS